MRKDPHDTGPDRPRRGGDDERRRSSERRHVARGGRRLRDRPGKHPTVLIAESYEGVRKSCARYLDRFNFRVAEAVNGEELLARVAAAPPQVIVTEMHLPAMPARRLATWLGQNWRTRHIPVIVMSSGMDLTKDEVGQLASAILVKPFSLGRMLDEIRRALAEDRRSVPPPS
jgi:DNA-binding NtrC family response regulator